MNTPDFTHAGYVNLLASLAALGYEARTFHDFDPASRHLLLRHDIDMSIQAAVPIAAAEAERGWTASYFVLVRTEMYNPFSGAAMADLARIAAMGHEIGVHFDCSLYTDDGEALDKAAAAECRVLEDMTARPVRLISFHRPARSLLGRAAPLAGRPHTYMPRFYSDIGYCSDSQGRWRFGHPLAHAAVVEKRALQLLTHPIWWEGSACIDVQQRLEAFAEERRRMLRRELAANCQTFRLLNLE